MKHFVATLGTGNLALMEFETIKEARKEAKNRLKIRRHDEVIFVFSGEKKEATP